MTCSTRVGRSAVVDYVACGPGAPFFKTETDLPEGGRGDDVRCDHSQANSSPSIGHQTALYANELEDVLQKCLGCRRFTAELGRKGRQ